MLSPTPLPRNSKPSLITLFFKKSKLTKSKLAFSLIEISVVILVIGILIAGISKGMDLYQDFKLSTARNLTTNSKAGRIPGLTVWLETTSEKSFNKATPSDNSLIELWKDINPQRTEKIDAFQSDNSLKPTYVTKGINGLPSIRFIYTPPPTETSDLLTTQNIRIRDFLSDDQATIFIVQNSLNSTSSSIIEYGTTGENRLNIHAPYSNNFIYFDYGSNPGYNYGRIQSDEPISSNFHNKNKILTFVKSPNSMKLTINTNEIVASNQNIVSRIPEMQVPLRLGGKSDCLIGEMMFFDRALSTSEIKAVEEYLSQKWGIKLVN